MRKKTVDAYRNLILVELLTGGTQCTYVAKNRLRSKGVYLETRQVLIVMKRLENLGFVTSDKGGLGYSWTLTAEGREKAKSL